MSVVGWMQGHLPEMLVVLFVGGVAGLLADSAYAWLFDDDSWVTNTLVVGGIALSITLPLITHMLHRASIEDAKLDGQEQ
jgi:hypothetical protein